MNILILIVVLFSTVSCKMTLYPPGHFSTPNVTTENPTTVTATTHSTTTHSTTTHATPTTPTTPKPTPPNNVYFVNGTNGICLLFHANIKISFGNIHQTNTTKSYEISKVDSFEGSCGSSDETITLHFFKDWTLQLQAHKVDNASYEVSQVRLTYNTDTFPVKLSFSHNGVANVTRPKDYTNGFGQEYTCRSGLLLNDTLSQWNYTMMAWLDDFKFEAFRGNSTTTQFNANGQRSCEADILYNNLIPIIVGGVLVLLIIVVLVAYLISRRSRRSGYESV